jgi:hypothetical protein
MIYKRIFDNTTWQIAYSRTEDEFEILRYVDKGSAWEFHRSYYYNKDCVPLDVALESTFHTLNGNEWSTVSLDRFPIYIQEKVRYFWKIRRLL